MTQKKVCPHCGVCPTCGRGPVPTFYYPMWPSYPTYPVWPLYPQITYTVTGTNTAINTLPNVT